MILQVLELSVMKNVVAIVLICCISLTVSGQSERLDNRNKTKGKRALPEHPFQEKYSSLLQSENGIDPSAVDIVRDAYGVPHIFAKTDAEVAYGLAWAHAEDDFYTIQKSFLASKGMLGMQTGREGATIDYIVSLLRIRELVDSLYEPTISTYYKEVLQGYCDGFNAFARTHQKEVLEKRAFPVTPKDVIAYSVLQLAVGCGVDAALKKIYGGTVDLAFDLQGGEESSPNAFDTPQGSNAFAFNSKKTADGKVYLAINTHHPLEGQVAWYEAHLSSEQGWNIVGALFPGSPVIFTGVNENLAWTHTVNHPDKLDVYQLEMNPENKLQYNVDGKWHTLEEDVVKLRVKVPGFNLHMKKKSYWSIYGPTVVTDRGVFSIRTAGIMDIRGLEQWFWMNKSKSFKEFKSALKMESLPGYNIVYGDRYDTIFYLSNGRLPVREKGYNWKSTVPGNTYKTLWTKFHPIEKLPQVLNPASGYVYNANHSPFNATAKADNIQQKDFDALMGYETHDNNRSIRVMEMMGKLDKVSYADFKSIKYDLQLPDSLAFPVDVNQLFALEENKYPEVAELISILKSWDRKGTIDSRGAAIFSIFFYNVAERYKQNENFKYMTEEDCVETLLYVKNYLQKNFGTTKITLGDYQRLERDNVSIPLPGLPDVLAAMYSTPTENGRVKGAVGECYIGLIQFTNNGPEIETVNCFGASNRNGSKHFADQMELFQQQKTKKMYLDKASVIAQARTIYHPEVLTRHPQSARASRKR
jgi:acyl-homoserine-lactone acylase